MVIWLREIMFESSEKFKLQAFPYFFPGLHPEVK